MRRLGFWVALLSLGGGCSFAPDLGRFAPCGPGGECAAGSTCLVSAGRCIPDCGGVDPALCVTVAQDAGPDAGADSGVDAGIDGGADAGDGGADAGDAGAMSDAGFRFTKSTPVPGVETRGYSDTFTTVGGVSPVVFSLAPGSALPAGVTLAATGLLSSSALPAGTFPFSVQAKDSDSPPKTIEVATSLAVAPLLRVLSPAHLPDAIVGQQYFEPLDVFGGTAPYSITFASGQLPPGMGLSTTPPRVIGTPSTPGAYTFSANVAEAPTPGQFVTRSYAVDVVTPDGGLTMLTRGLNDAKVGRLTTVRLRATGGVPPYGWSVSGTAVPGFSITDPADAGTWQGTPATAGGASVTLVVTDAVGATATRTFNFIVF